MLSIIPPLVAIGIALLTKQTLLSLFIGVWVGATIIHNWNPFVGFLNVIPEFMVPSITDPFNAGLLILVALAGGFIQVLRVTGSAQAFAKIATRRIDTRKKAQTMTWGSAFLFSYTEPVLILGTIMRPLSDKLKVSRAKLAYILDGMGASIAAMSPISSYGPFITGLIGTQIAAIGISSDPWALFLQMIPYNLYGIFAMLTVLFVIRTNLDIGPMYYAEKRAVETGQLYSESDVPLVKDEKDENIPFEDQLTFYNFLIPMILLFSTIFGVIFWSGNIFENGLRGSFINADIVLAISSGFIVGSMGAAILSVKSGFHSITSIFDSWTKGIIKLMIVPMILVLAWSIGKVTTDMELGQYLAQLAHLYLPTFIIPGVIFLLAGIIAFSTGSSWGVYALMMPIAIPMADTLDIALPIAIGAVISGGLFGDHCSPISDTTILASTGAACDHIEHVRTQFPYAILVSVCAFIGYIAAGLTESYWISIGTTAVLIILLLYILNKKVKRQMNTNYAERVG